jgi:GTP cyclohydrolase I
VSVEPDQKDNAIECYTNLVNYMRETGHYDRANMKDSIERGARALREMVLPRSEILKGVVKVLSTQFPARKDSGMVIRTSIRSVSLCPHHFLPVIYYCDLAYIPDGKLLGISKPTRLATLLARRPILQEDYTDDLADVMSGTIPSSLKSKRKGPILPTLGAAVRVVGWHSCMACRGVTDPNATAITRSVRGIFLEDARVMAEFDASLPQTKGFLL